MNRLISLLVVLLWLTACSQETPVTSEGEKLVTYQLVDGRQLDSDQLKAFVEAQKDALEAYEAKDYGACISNFHKAIEIYDRNELAFYNLAACQAPAGDGAAALVSLRKAMDLGFIDFKWAREDEDLSSIHESEEFAQLIADMEVAKEEKKAQGFDPAAGDTHPLEHFESVEAIDKYFDLKAKERRKLAQVLGRQDWTAEGHQSARTQVVAYRQWLEDQPEDWPARFRLVELLKDFYPRTPQYGAELEAMLVLAPESSWSAAAQLLLEQQKLSDLAKEDSDQKAEAGAAEVERLARHLVETYADEPIAKYGHLSLIRRATEQDDIEQMTSSFTWLEERREELEAVWSRYTFLLNNTRIRVRGIPDFEAEDLAGNTWSKESMKGKVVLVDFWATWCGPCIAEMPTLKELYAEYGDQGFEIFGVSGDEMEREKFEAWLTKEEVSWPQNFTGEGWETELFQRFEIEGIPTAILIDREGNIAGVDLRGDDLKAKVNALMS